MKTRFASTALVACLLAPQIALATGGGPNPPVCSDFPRMGLEYALGGYTSVGLDPDLEDELDDHLNDIVTQLPGESQTAGAVVMVARQSKIVYHKASGLRDGNTSEGGDPMAMMPTNAIFDLESMTKPFTAAVILEMDAAGLLDLDDLVIDYLPDFANVDVAGPPPSQALDPYKSDVTIRDMLRYMGGLSVESLAKNVYGSADPFAAMSAEPGIAATGTEVLYSDLTYRLLAHIAEVAYADASPTAKTFRQLVAQYVTGPLGMQDTDFEPILTMSSKMSRVAGTGYFSHYLHNPDVPGGYRRGEVQDDQDWWVTRNNPMFGTAAIPTGTGCDGLFSTALDLGKFAQALIDNGSVWDPMTCNYIPVLDWATVSGLTTIQTLDGNGDPVGLANPPSWTDDLLLGDKAFGFELMDQDKSVGGSVLTGVFKTGGAGTFLLIDRSRDLFIVVLTNHGLPSPADAEFAGDFDGMLDEIGPHRIADSVAAAITSSGPGSGSSM